MRKTNDMKKIFVIIMCGLLWQTAFAQNFKVTASIRGLADGTVLILTPLSHSKLAPVAEATVSKGKCVFTGTITQDVPLCVHMQVKDAFGYVNIMIDKGNDFQVSCTFRQDGENKGTPIYRISDLKVTGSPLTEQYLSIKKDIQKPNEEFGEFRKLLHKRMPALEGEMAKAMKKGRAGLDSLKKANADFQMYQYMDSIRYNLLSNSTICKLYELGDTFWGPLMMIDTWWYFTPRERPVYDSFTEEVKNCWYGRQIRDEVYAGGKPGEKAKAFTISDQKGSKHTLSSLLKDKKVVLIDFWASWCGPCRKEIPNVKKQYELYKDKGFDVISISIDKDEKAWKKALEEEKLPWPNFLDREGVSDIYKVKSIPAMFLLKGDGTIIATDLDARGENLAKKLAELFK